MAAKRGNSNALGNQGGRASLYKEAYADQAYKLCLLGSTDKEISDFFNVSVRTLNNWKKEHIEFLHSLKKGKSIADAHVAERLYTRAIGYTFQEVTFERIDSKSALEATSNDAITIEPYRKKIVIKEVVPDTTAQIFWLKNRSKENWRDKQSFEIDFDKMSETDLDMLIDRIIKGQTKK